MLHRGCPPPQAARSRGGRGGEWADRASGERPGARTSTRAARVRPVGPLVCDAGQARARECWGRGAAASTASAGAGAGHAVRAARGVLGAGLGQGWRGVGAGCACAWFVRRKVRSLQARYLGSLPPPCLLHSNPNLSELGLGVCIYVHVAQGEGQGWRPVVCIYTFSGSDHRVQLLRVHTYIYICIYMYIYVY